MVNDPELIHFQKGSLWIMISSLPTDRLIKTSRYIIATTVNTDVFNLVGARI